MQKTLTQEFLLRFSESDRFGRMKLRTFFDYAQEIAGVHAALLGVGTEALRASKQAWFLSRVHMKINAYPVVGDRVEVLTYPCGFERLFARREFQMSVAGKGVMATATTDWLLMDIEAMRILPAPRLLASIMPDNSDLPISFPELGKLQAPDEENAQKITEFPIRGTMIDINAHMNNAEYAGILQDVLGMGVYPREFQLNYQKGVPPESRLVVAETRDAEGNFACAGRVDGAVAFEAAGTLFDKIEEGDNIYGI